MPVLCVYNWYMCSKTTTGAKGLTCLIDWHKKPFGFMELVVLTSSRVPQWVLTHDLPPLGYCLLPQWQERITTWPVGTTAMLGHCTYIAICVRKRDSNAMQCNWDSTCWEVRRKRGENEVVWTCTHWEGMGRGIQDKECWGWRRQVREEEEALKEEIYLCC